MCFDILYFSMLFLFRNFICLAKALQTSNKNKQKMFFVNSVKMTEKKSNSNDQTNLGRSVK